MNKYHVTYFYLATGMEGRGRTENFGIVSAETPDEAINKVALKEIPIDELYGPTKRWSRRDFFKSCLSADKVEGLEERS